MCRQTIRIQTLASRTRSQNEPLLIHCTIDLGKTSTISAAQMAVFATELRELISAYLEDRCPKS